MFQLKYTTKSAVADGTIEVRSNPNQDLSGLSRDTDKALNELGKIFDKKKIEEQQELAKLFGELAYEQVHKVSSKNKENAEKELNKAKADKNSTPEQLAALQAKVDAWSEGGANKIALHALVGGIMSDITGGGFTSGAVGAGGNEAVQKELEKRFKNNPDMWQWASALIGAAASKAAGGSGQTGASTAVSGTKNNRLNEYEREQFVQELMTALANGARAEALQGIIARYKDLAIDDEKSKLDEVANFFGTSRELDDNVKAFLKDQLGYDWDEAFKTIKSYNPDATDADVWDNLYGHVKTNEGAIAWRANQNKEELIEASGPVKGETLLSLGKASSINWGADGIAESVNDEEGNPHDLETPLSRGDYEYKKNGIEPFPDSKTNMWYISTSDGDCPVYGLGSVGDYYAKLGYNVELGADGGHYVTAPDGSPWYTSAPLTSVREQVHEEQKKVIEDTDDLLLLMNSGRAGGIGLNKGVTKDVETIIKGSSKSIPTWKGSGPAPGVLGVNGSSQSVQAIKNYYPSTSNGAIEFVFDPKTNTFVVGKPQQGLFAGSGHEKLARTINADESTAVGGMFSRGANGEILTNEASGHFHQNWTPEIRKKFQEVMQQYGLEIEHHKGI